MQIMKMNENVEFVNESYSTRSGFAHKSHLFVNGIEWGHATRHYLNRTWECYPFQSVMLEVVQNEMQNLKERFEDSYRISHGIKRMTAKMREQMESEFHMEAYDKLVEIEQWVKTY